MLTVSVVIPVYRAAQTLRELYGQLSITMPQIAPTFEIIFVEDCGGGGRVPRILLSAPPHVHLS